MTRDQFETRPDREEVRAAWGLAMAALSITLLIVAYFVRETFGVALSLAGVSGLFALRLTTGRNRPIARTARIPRRRSPVIDVSAEPSDLRFAHD